MARTNRGAAAATSEKNIAARKRAQQAVELRLAGATYQQIADQLDYYSAANAYRAVTSAMARVQQQPALELIQVQELRYDRLLRGVWGQAIQGHLGASAQALRIEAQRAQLRGLNKQSDTAGAQLVGSMLEQLLRPSAAYDDTDPMTSHPIAEPDHEYPE